MNCLLKVDLKEKHTKIKYKGYGCMDMKKSFVLEKKRN